MSTKSGTMSIGEWLITFIILMIPLVNIVMLFVWGFGSGVNPSKKNYAKATLILFAIFIGLYIIVGISMGPAIFRMMDSFKA